MDSRILIVDDQQSNVRLLEHTLRRGGFASIATTTDPCAVAALQLEHHYDLILLDCVMPGMDGFQVMKALGRDVPVLIMTADSRQETRAMQAGARDFISKPFVLTDVVTRVSRLLSLPVPLPRESLGLSVAQAILPGRAGDRTDGREAPVADPSTGSSPLFTERHSG